MTIFGGSTTHDNDLFKKKCYVRDIYHTTGEKRLQTPSIIAFTEEDLEEIVVSHHDPLVITPIVGRGDGGNSRLSRVLIDTGPFIHAMYWDAFINLRLTKGDLMLGGSPLALYPRTYCLVISKAAQPLVGSPIPRVINYYTFIIN